jgi:ring-1,2-phenylacetyl-CoA epoxidase subunit PaaE
MAQQAIHFEYFRAGPQTASRPRPPSTTEKPAVAGAEAVAIVDGTRRTFRVGADQRVVDAALAQGIKLPYSCKSGMCCTCRAKLVEGEVTMDRNFSLEAWEMEAGFVLTCQARPTTPRVVLDYDRV